MGEMIRNIWDHQITIGDTVIFTLASTAVAGVGTLVTMKVLGKKLENWEEELFQDQDVVQVEAEVL